LLLLRFCVYSLLRFDALSVFYAFSFNGTKRVVWILDSDDIEITASWRAHSVTEQVGHYERCEETPPYRRVKIKHDTECFWNAIPDIPM